jgi:hypothetical protein
VSKKHSGSFLTCPACRPYQYASAVLLLFVLFSVLLAVFA